MSDQHLLDILQAHGQKFLDSFSTPNDGRAAKRKRTEDVQSSQKPPKLQHSNDSEAEWGGITGEVDDENTNSEASSSKAEEGTSASDSGFNKIVIFQDIPYGLAQPNQSAKAHTKAFMSSKVSKLREDIPGAPSKEKIEEDEEDERSNAQNDAILHRLVHTQLLSSSSNPGLDIGPAHRRKVIAGRLLELSGQAKLGRGEKSVRDTERNKASKRVRDGLVGRQKEKARQELEEAKDLGNYHPTIKNLFETSRGSSTKRRERGLGMGVGKFHGGFLKLGRDDISIAEGGGNGRSRFETDRGRGRRKTKK